MRAALALIALLVAGCGQQSAQPPETTAETSSPALTLSCADFSGATPATLSERFGAENVTTQTLPGAEGESYEATLVYANDPTRRLEITWNEDHSALATVTVGGASTQWRGAEGYTIGTPIADIERINVMPFKLWGFGWDYGGRVSDWGAGALGQNPICRNSIGFSPRGDSNTSAMGDSEFSSNDPAVRAADPVVIEFGLMIASANAEQ